MICKHYTKNIYFGKYQKNKGSEFKTEKCNRKINNVNFTITNDCNNLKCTIKNVFENII